MNTGGGGVAGRGHGGAGDGLNPNRQRGFSGRIETPSLKDMRAKQGAVVSKFLNFMNRKRTVDNLPVVDIEM